MFECAGFAGALTARRTRSRVLESPEQRSSITRSRRRAPNPGPSAQPLKQGGCLSCPPWGRGPSLLGADRGLAHRGSSSVLKVPPPSVAPAVRSAAVSDPVELGVYREDHAFLRRSNWPPMRDSAFPAVPNGGLPWAPSLTQSPWLANVPSASGTSVFHPPFWQTFAVSSLWLQAHPRRPPATAGRLDRHGSAADSHRA
jgi:hypothetical protein